MEEEKSIEFTDDEILMIRSFCQNTLALEPQNAELATSILSKLSGAESSEIPIKAQPTLKKRGRPRKTLVEMPRERPPSLEPDPSQFKVETTDLPDEVVLEPQPLAVSTSTELKETIAEKLATNFVNNPKLNFLQLLIQKIRPVIRQ
jgi:hypothetical protein